jgi:hypothetical protein
MTNIATRRKQQRVAGAPIKRGAARSRGKRQRQRVAVVLSASAFDNAVLNRRLKGSLMVRGCAGAAGLLCMLLLTAGAFASGDMGQSRVDGRAHAGRGGGRGVGAPPVASVPRFTSAVQLNVGANPLRMVAADLNTDGKPDVATVDWTSSTVSILFGRGDGTFRKRIRYRTARRPAGITASDVNGDGNPDLVIASADRAGSISVFLSRGSGRFRRAGIYSAGRKAYAVAAADIDQDGIVDLVSAHFSREHFVVLLGTGAGRFRIAHRYAGGRATDVAIGDLNGDGKLDVALAVANGNSVGVRLGIGDGTFGAALAYKSGSFPFGVTLADFNHDDKLDIAAANYGGSTVSVFPGIGDGTFGARSRYLMGHQESGTGTTNVDTVVVADLDRDGNLDIATPEYEQPIVRRGRGDGTFETQRAVSEGFFSSVGGAVADFNRDGWPDLAFSGACEELEFDCDAFPTVAAYVFLNWTARSTRPCVVPDLTPRFGLGLREAARQLRLAGCRLGDVRSRLSRKVGVKNRVISQHPRQGAVLRSQARVDLVVSRGRPR